MRACGSDPGGAVWHLLHERQTGRPKGGYFATRASSCSDEQAYTSRPPGHHLPVHVAAIPHWRHQHRARCCPGCRDDGAADAARSVWRLMREQRPSLLARPRDAWAALTSAQSGSTACGGVGSQVRRARAGGRPAMVGARARALSASAVHSCCRRTHALRLLERLLPIAGRALPPTSPRPRDGPRRPSAGLCRARVAILDDALRPVQVDSIGQIATAGPHVMFGYWRQPAHHAGYGGRLAAHGTLASYSDGELHFAGRIKDVIKSGNVPAATVEHALLAHPLLAEAAVFGLPDKTYGERVVAAVVARPHAPRRWPSSLGRAAT